ncbi:hypothetical protein Cgig2_004481 [Carnegiea gigantea]|uniref:Uncharacterized protein n=1 Tax=Carnegiea gigantea TaxID=171969 RepID=A0A9Q1JRI0_9CARY|nr:hypothetical protein Cgig2_004481 [Carnegiea gigantea]
MLRKTKQIIHFRLSSNRHFHITLVYGFNQDCQRIWNWGADVQDMEIKHIIQCIEAYELLKMRSTGLYFSCSNKTTWSRIDWAVANNPKFENVVQAFYQALPSISNMHKLKIFLCRLRGPFKELSKDIFKPQLLRQEEECKANYISIIRSSFSLVKQQSKTNWIACGVDCTKFFFTRAEQRKLATYIYALPDPIGEKVDVFEEVAKVMAKFYIGLLGNTLSIKRQLELCHPFTHQEIKDAIFSIPNTKYPGHDGYLSDFLKPVGLL